MTRVPKNLLIILLLFVALFSNSSIIGPFRFVDLIIPLIVVLLGPKFRLKYDDILLIFLFMALGLTSSLMNITNLTNPNDIAFYYKYLFYFLSLVIATSICQPSPLQPSSSAYRENEKRKKFIIFLVRSLAIFHLIYIFQFYLANIGGVIGGSTRVSLPFSTLDVGTSNAPAYSVVIGLFFIFLYENKNSYFDLLIGLFLLVGLLATGSRSGIFCLLLYLTLFKRPMLDRYILLTLGVIVVFFVFFLEKMGSLFVDLISRALNFNLVNDQSANDRTAKQIGALIDVSETRFTLLGLGHENTKIVWYDGLLGNLLIFGGILALIICIVLVIKCAMRMDPKVRIFVLVPFLVSFVSEFILTSYVVGTALFLLVASKEIKSADRFISAK